MGESLPHGPLGDRTAHICVDMQTVFAERTDWHLPWMRRVLPTVVRVARARPKRTVFTRFVPPQRADEMPGCWRRYFERWSDMTRERMDDRMVELLPDLRALVPPAAVVDKNRYSPFTESGLLDLLRQWDADTLVVTGAETEVCVLATVLGAVDLGFRVVVATDAVCSAADKTHDAMLTVYRERFGQQIEAATADVILANWR
jgi:nicotinamidase-related amidase